MTRHPGRAGGSLHLVTSEPRPADDTDFGRPLTWPGDPKALPYLDVQGELVLPTNCPRRFRWWQLGGQSLQQTITDLGGVV